MSKREKALRRLASRPKDFTWDEAVALMGRCGFRQVNSKRSGSHRTFFHEEKDLLIRICQPHPSEILKTYQVDELIRVFKEGGYIND